MAERSIILVIALISCVLLQTIMAQPANNEDALLQTIAASNAAFSRNFYKFIGRKHEGNLVASPLSAQLVLVMAQLGARGATAEEMRVALSLPADVEVVKKGFNTFMKTLTSSEQVVLEIANRLYLKEGFNVKTDFTNAMLEAFNSSVQSVNFVDPDVRVKINQWVEETTHDKIKNLIPEGVLDSLTRLVLINAVYFKGPWLSPFDKEQTRPMPFYTDETNSIEIPFMYQKAHYGYTKLEALDAQLIEMPYAGRQLSLVIILPNKRTGLAELEEKMGSLDLSDLMQNAFSRELSLYLPKFKLEVSLQLNDYLKEMGMSKMFSSGADFSGIADEDLAVSYVLQKAFIEVSEEGTEAAAATAVVMIRKSMPMPRDTLKVTLDHPFNFYLIQRGGARFSNKERVILFSGRLTHF